MNGTELFQKLKQNPGNVVRYTCMTLAGYPHDGVHQFQAVPDGQGRSNRKPGRHLGKLANHDAVAFTIRPPFPGAQHTTMAYAVTMQGHDNAHHPNYAVGNLTGMHLPNVGGPSLMFTGQLSGCTFVILPVATGVYVAHLEPDTPNGVSGAALQIDVDANLRFVNPAAGPLGGGPHLNAAGAGLTTYGRGHGYAMTKNATVIGSRIGAGWQFWAQSYDSLTKQIQQSQQIY